MSRVKEKGSIEVRWVRALLEKSSPNVVVVHARRASASKSTRARPATTSQAVLALLPILTMLVKLLLHVLLLLHESSNTRRLRRRAMRRMATKRAPKISARRAQRGLRRRQ